MFNLYNILPTFAISFVGLTDKIKKKLLLYIVNPKNMAAVGCYSLLIILNLT